MDKISDFTHNLVDTFQTASTTIAAHKEMWITGTFYISLKLIPQRIPFGCVLPSVADPDTNTNQESGVRDPGFGSFLTPGSGIQDG